ncbi:MAG: HAD-IC family P-type ATPase, partial [Bacteroidia bacterium]|nr:HAD-IC family P-type ATPase [Bacteroidia bacterium]
QQSNYVENRSILIKLGVAGFCAGNIMMFSFPQYLGLDVAKDVAFGKMFNALNIVLSLPLIFYCAADYFKAFFQWIKYKTISVKVPLALGIGALWLRSIYEVSTFNGAGYFDSLAGLIFFLIIGTWLQNRAFDAMRFGEKARKFFPLVSRTVVNNKLVPKKVVDLVVGDRVRVVYGEIIPADGILMGSEAIVEYSYATGESAPQFKVAGEVLLGGGKNMGSQFEMEVIRPFDQSRLNEIWNSGEKEAADGKKIVDFEAVISKYFIFTTVFIALAALGFWWFKDASKAWFAFTAVLMVACPCALALAPPFAYNIVANFYATKGLFLRKPGVAGQMGQISGVVFDKTGTLTLNDKIKAIIPKEFTEKEIRLLVSLAAQSKHPYSMAISAALEGYELLPVEQFQEIPGKGSTGVCGSHLLKLGSMEFVSGNINNALMQNKELWFSIDNRVLIPIAMQDVYRNSLMSTFNQLKNQGKKLTVASGDTWAEGQKMQNAFPGVFDQVFFECKPAEKAKVIEEYQKTGHVLMVGDGLNDAGALKTGDVGMVVSENTNNFTPEASAILLQDSFHKLPDFLRIAGKANRVVKETFVVSLTYNAIALALAFTGQMSPLIAAILMPASSVALMLYAWARTKIMVGKEHRI